MNAADDIANPLLPIVLKILRETVLCDTEAGISEYELLKKLEAAGANFPMPGIEADLLLFQKHFLLMNALYRLQDLLWREERMWLTISPLRIGLEALAERASASAVDAAANTALRDYYLDWRQFEIADNETVAALLGSFWQRLHAQDGRIEALQALQLAADADWADVQNQYRRLAAQTHPDRGGDSARFLIVREAYEVLRIAMRGR